MQISTLNSNCGVFVLTGVASYEPRKALRAIRGHSSYNLFVFSDGDKTGYDQSGAKLAQYIRDNDLGEVIGSGWVDNPVHAYKNGRTQVWLWKPKWDVVKLLCDKEFPPPPEKKVDTKPTVAPKVDPQPLIAKPSGQRWEVIGGVLTRVG